MLSPLPVEARPLGADEAEALLAPLLDCRHVLLAVSGGPDSTALMGLATQWATSAGRPAVSVATVDHALRDGSGADASLVCGLASSLGLACETLVWTGPKPSTGLQEAARLARYALLADRARVIGADAVVTAHTLDDQAETVLMRLAAGSGITGLAAMRTRSRTEGLVHLRPLLSVPKARLIATCLHNGWSWIADPANTAPRFARARLRAARDVLAREGLTPERLVTLARRAQDASEAIRWAAQPVLADATVGAGLDLRRLAGTPYALALAALQSWLEDRGGQARLQRLETCATALLQAVRAGVPLRRTLGGHVLALSADGLLRIAPERRRRGLVNPVGQSRLGKGRGQP